MKLKAFIILGILAIVVLSSLYFGGTDSKNRGSPAAAPKANVLRIPGRIQAEREAQVAFRVGGRIESIAVRDGQRVDRGETLARLDARTQQAVVRTVEAKIKQLEAELRSLQVKLARKQVEIEEAIEVAQVALASARNEYKTARKDFRRAKELTESNVVAEERYDHAAREKERWRLRVESAEHELSRAENNRQLIPELQSEIERARHRLAELRAQSDREQVRLEDHTLTAPFDGSVVLLHKEAGECVSGGEPVLHLVDLSSLYFEADIPEEHIGSFEERQQVEVELVSLPGVPITGEVTRVANASKESLKLNLLTEEEENREYVADVAVPADQVRLRLGLRGYLRPEPDEAASEQQHILQDDKGN